MRHDYPEFVSRNAEIVSVGPEAPEKFRDYWKREKIPFVGLADPGSIVAGLYEQEVSLLKLGRMPEMVVVDREGRIVYRHFARSMSDIPPNDDILLLLDDLEQR